MKHLIVIASLALPSFADAEQVTFEVKTVEDETVPATRWQLDAQQLLFARVGELDYLIAPRDPKWSSYHIEVEYISDLDGDGEPEAIVSTSQGGNCCGPSYFIVSHRGGGFFSAQTHEALTGFATVSLRDVGGTTLLHVENWEYDGPGEIANMEQSLFSFTHGTLHLLSRSQNVAMLSAVVEVTAKDVIDGPKSIAFDRNDDGEEETLVCSYWERWQSVNCTSEQIPTPAKLGFDLQIGCTRVGILASVTNGFHDLVCDRSKVFKLNSTTRRYEG